MTAILQDLVRRASVELGSTACQAGRHTWGFDGGRACPHDLDSNCSQAVYRCIVCGQHDYGERDGPGEADCDHHCHHRIERARAIALKRIDPLRHIWNTSPKINHFLLLRALRRQPKPRLP